MAEIEQPTGKRALGVRVRYLMKRAAEWLVNAAKAIVKFGRQRFTVMLIPHSEQKVVNFQINTFSMVFLGMLVVVLLGGFFYLATAFSGSSRILARQSEQLDSTEASLDVVREEVANVVSVSRLFEDSLSETLEGLRIDGPDGEDTAEGATGDLSAFLNLQEVSPNEVQEVQELQGLVSTLQSSVEPLRQIRGVLDAQKELLGDIPHFWPVAEGRGRVTMEFGPNIHPVTNQWYLHKGIDIYSSPGTPAVAAANGKVVELGVDPGGYGVYVWVRHKYGFKTRYSHLQRSVVSEGQEILQGQTIGTVGNTGLSTGPHLDFQIWLGSELVDPAAFLKISSDFDRWTGNR
ncbi:MAG: M23 family metallopeptidase [Spirochaetaceae bacterium]